MAVTFKIMTFDVTRCGYYRRGQDEPEFGTLSEILSDLKQWVVGKSLRAAKTFDPPEGADALPVYCFDIRPSNDGSVWLLTTWNETPSAEGGVQAANGDTPVGAVDVTIAEVDPNAIPGFPTYFVFLPARKLVFAVRPDGQRHNGHEGMTNFLSSYIRNAASYRVLNDGANIDPALDNEVLGYRNEEGAPPLPLNPMFRSRPRRLPGAIEYLRGQRESIRKLVRRDKLTVTVVKDRDLISRLLDNVGLLNGHVARPTLRLGYEMDFMPSEAEFEAIVEVAEAEAPIDGGEVGFRLRGENEVRWLSHAFAKDDWELPVEPGASYVFRAEQLLEALQARQAHLIALAKAAE